MSGSSFFVLALGAGAEEGRRVAVKLLAGVVVDWEEFLPEVGIAFPPDYSARGRSLGSWGIYCVFGIKVRG